MASRFTVATVRSETAGPDAVSVAVFIGAGRANVILVGQAVAIIVLVITGLCSGWINVGPTIITVGTQTVEPVSVAVIVVVDTVDVRCAAAAT